MHKRRQGHKITLFYKMFNHRTSVYLPSLIPQQVNAFLITVLGTQKTFIPSGLILASFTIIFFDRLLGNEIRQPNTLSSFKTLTKKDLQSVPTYYYCCSRKV